MNDLKNFKAHEHLKSYEAVSVKLFFIENDVVTTSDGVPEKIEEWLGSWGGSKNAGADGE